MWPRFIPYLTHLSERGNTVRGCRVHPARAFLRYTRSLISARHYSASAADIFSGREWHDMRCPETCTWGAAGPRGAWDCPPWTGPPAGHTPGAVRWAGSRCDRPAPGTTHRSTDTAAIITRRTIRGRTTSGVRCWRSAAGRWRWARATTGPGPPPGPPTPCPWDTSRWIAARPWTMSASFSLYAIGATAPWNGATTSTRSPTAPGRPGSLPPRTSHFSENCSIKILTCRGNWATSRRSWNSRIKNWAPRCIPLRPFGVRS